MAARITDAARLPRPDTAHKIKHALHGWGGGGLHVVKLRCIKAAIVGKRATAVCV